MLPVLRCLKWDFYPRSPCGERHNFQQGRNGQNIISIHALLAESDSKKYPPMCTIRHFYPRSPCGERHRNVANGERKKHISIHALLAESD